MGGRISERWFLNGERKDYTKKKVTWLCSWEFVLNLNILERHFCCPIYLPESFRYLVHRKFSILTSLQQHAISYISAIISTTCSFYIFGLQTLKWQQTLLAAVSAAPPLWNSNTSLGWSGQHPPCFVDCIDSIYASSACYKATFICQYRIYRRNNWCMSLLR